jgi:hypothetical protein
MESDHHVKECSCHYSRRVPVAEQDEVRGLREAVNDSEQHRVAVDAQESLNDVHAEVSPNCRGQLKRPKETSWLQVLCLVALAHQARAHEVLDGGACTHDVEVRL